jgi:hypothetical protein
MQVNEKYVGWSFDDLDKETEKVKKIRDPLSVLIYAAIFPFFKEGSKMSLANHSVTVQHADDYTYNLPVFNIRINLLPALRSPFWWKDNINNLEVFQLNTVNATELYNPVSDPVIQTLFESARDGLPAVKEAYKGQSTPHDVIDKYQQTIVHALEGRMKFDKGLSTAELAVKQIWSEKEIRWINSTITMMYENKAQNKAYDSGLKSILDKIQEKEAEFNEICQKVKAKALSTIKNVKVVEPDASSPAFGSRKSAGAPAAATTENVERKNETPELEIVETGEEEQVVEVEVFASPVPAVQKAATMPSNSNKKKGKKP